MLSIRQRHHLLGLVWTASLLAIFFLTMPMPPEARGDALIRWTVRHALAFWLASLLLRIDARWEAARLLWTLACVSYLVHVAMAFEFAHHWSHREAFEHVRAASGYGEGIFVSYFFTLLWVAEVTWWNVSTTDYLNRPRWWNGAVQGFMLFVAFNATVVFENGAIRWAGVVGFAVLAMWAGRRLTRRGTRDGSTD